MSEPTNRLAGDAPGEYHSYLVRIWRPGPQAAWRIMAEAVVTGERRTFASLEELLGFLQTELRSPPAPPDQPRSHKGP
ncbi:MAG: hypothetical protein KJZ93_12685 [Caldilineaceae bacterium]|nr:hypothetical protein [Caldilineaceae bacterium]